MEIPQSIIDRENNLSEKCKKFQNSMPSFLNDYYIYLNSNVLIKTKYDYLIDIEKFLRTYNIKTIEEIRLITHKEINRYLDSIESKSTKCRCRSALKSLFTILYRDKVIENNIINDINRIKTIKKNSNSKSSLNQKEINSLFEILKTGKGFTPKEKERWVLTKYRDKAIFTVLIALGLRVSEIRQLDLKSNFVDFNNLNFTVYRKGGSIDDIPFSTIVKKAIQDYIDYERCNIDSSNNALFLSLHKKRMSTNSYEKLVKKYTKLILKDGKGISPHKLRATVATRKLELGGAIHEVQDLLGHGDIRTTQIYTKSSDESRRNIVDNYNIIPE